MKHLFEPLSASDFKRLKADIAKHGVRIPIQVDESGDIIDGRERFKACQELGIKCPKTVNRGLTEKEKRQLLRQSSMSTLRKPQGNKRIIIASHLEDYPDHLNNAIAKMYQTGADLVADVRAEVGSHSPRERKPNTATTKQNVVTFRLKRDEQVEQYKMITEVLEGVWPDKTKGERVLECLIVGLENL